MTRGMPPSRILKFIARVAYPLLIAFTAAAPQARAQEITLDTVFAKEPPWGRLIDRISWSADGQAFLYVRRSQDPDEALPLMLYDVRNGTSRVWLRSRIFGAQQTPEVLGWSADGTRIALLAGGALYVRELRSTRLQKISDDVDDARWAPHGAALAYSHDADLYVALIGNRIVSRRLTTGGRPGDVLHATLDWVYPEELGIDRAFRWSPDARRIAYLTMDERGVTNFPIVDFMTVNNAVEHERYPLAGQRNPRVTLRVLEVAGGGDRLVYDAARHDEYLAAFDWIPQSNELEAEILDRPQRTMRFYAWSRASAPRRLLYYQASSTWVDVEPLPFWLNDGRSIWLLDRAPTAGMFLRGRDGTMQRLTGNYRVTDLYGVARGTLYLRAAYPTRRDRSVLAISLGGAVRNLTPEPGWHNAVPSPTLERFVDTASRLNDPPRVLLRDAVTMTVKTLVPERTDLKNALLPTRTFVIPSRYGTLDATAIFPPRFNASKRYPVVMYVYGGPDAPTTADSFGSLYHQLLARSGIIVYSVDGPASQVDSDEHVRLLYKNFGPGSLLGQEIGARYIASLPYVDPARIGIWGWSFGGYEACYALTHSRLFSAGAAVAPVTDWHLYDSIYTERYMGMPAANAGAYARSSVLNSAAHLSGPLLIQHGTADDNVHMANTVQLLQQFILAHETRVQFYPYPRKTHPIRGLPQQRSVFAHMLDFWRTVFLGRPAGRV
ncbi:MAG: DPP IV N-terminal domain-containing protein [Candidatus Eremiobacteraeota bacterium]|nr:DPP IV N-terminal domain-containing protein [Candidatus Eremiobacteraeota bacterium]